MNKTLIFLFLLLLSPVLAQAQLPVVQILDLPQGYEGWKTKLPTPASKKIKDGLVADKQLWINQVNMRSQFITVCRVNSEIVLAVYSDIIDDRIEAEASVYVVIYVLTNGGYVKLVLINEIGQELENNQEKAGEVWGKYIEEKFGLDYIETELLSGFCSPS